MTFNLFVVYKYFYASHYSLLVLNREINKPTCMTLVLRTFRLLFMLPCTSPAVHYRCGILCFFVPIFVGGNITKVERGALNVY